MTQEPSSQRKFYSFTAGVCGTWGHRMNASSAHLVLGLVRCTPPIGLWNVQVRQKTHSRRLDAPTHDRRVVRAHIRCARGVCGAWGHRRNAPSAHLVLGLVRCTPPIDVWEVKVRKKTHSRRLCTNTRPACGACAHQMCARCVWHLGASDERA